MGTSPDGPGCAICAHWRLVGPSPLPRLWVASVIVAADVVIAELSEVLVLVDLRKGAWGALNGRWFSHHIRDDVIDFVSDRSEKTDLAPARFAAAPSPTQPNDGVQKGVGDVPGSRP